MMGSHCYSHPGRTVPYVLDDSDCSCYGIWLQCVAVVWWSEYKAETKGDQWAVEFLEVLFNIAVGSFLCCAAIFKLWPKEVFIKH